MARVAASLSSEGRGSKLVIDSNYGNLRIYVKYADQTEKFLTAEAAIALLEYDLEVWKRRIIFAIKTKKSAAELATFFSACEILCQDIESVRKVLNRE